MSNYDKIMLGFHFQLVTDTTLHWRFKIGIEQDKRIGDTNYDIIW
jgi:hypothetical protein